GPGELGKNCTLSWHSFFGDSCGGQFVTNPNTSGPISVASGLPKVIGGPSLTAGLLISSVTLLESPTFTLPKFTSVVGLTVSDSGTAVGVAVGVAVAVAVGVAVAVVAVAVGVGDDAVAPTDITRL